jgi:hypothetical protein
VGRKPHFFSKNICDFSAASVGGTLFLFGAVPQKKQGCNFCLREQTRNCKPEQAAEKLTLPVTYNNPSEPSYLGERGKTPHFLIKNLYMRYN